MVVFAATACELWMGFAELQLVASIVHQPSILAKQASEPRKLNTTVIKYSIFTQE